MRIVLQRVKEAKVSVDGDVVGSIKNGLLLFVGVGKDTNENIIQKLADKVINLRIFEDSDGRFNLSAKDSNAELLIISQFTLYANCKKGRRPDFFEAAPPETGKVIFEKFVDEIRKSDLKTETGIFGAMMDIYSINDGPVTISIDQKDFL